MHLKRLEKALALLPPMYSTHSNVSTTELQELVERDLREPMRLFNRLDSREMRVSLLIAAASDDVNEADKADSVCGHGWDLYVHLAPLCRPKAPVVAEVRACVRHDPTVKSTEWLRERQHIEASLGADANEALLLDKRSGELLEGLSSNFFVLFDDDDDDRQRRRLQTAPESLVLNGTIRRSVLAACERLNVQVDCTPPNIAERDQWAAAFITSSSRSVMPLHLLRFADKHVTLEHHPLVDTLYEHVETDLASNAHPILPMDSKASASHYTSIE
jgi:Amino-transferase class IV